MTAAPAPLDATGLSPWLFGAAIACITILVVLLALLAAAETGLAQSSRGKLRARADKGDERAARVLALAEDELAFSAAALLGRIVAIMLAVVIAGAVVTHSATTTAIITAVSTTFAIVLAEFLPRGYALLAPENVAIRLLRPANAIARLFAPLVAVLRLIQRGLLRLFGQPDGPFDHATSVQEEIAGTLAISQTTGGMGKEDRDRLRGALDLADRSVEEIMLHRSQIEMIDADLAPDLILDRVLQSPHTRLPVFRGERENVIGVLHAKDLLRAVNRAVRDGGAEALRGFDVLAIAMPPYFIPDTTALDEQLREFLARHTHFALVVDEYGSLRGLLTLEDILEEIVGDINDEHDRGAGLELKPNRAGDYIVDGAMTIRDLNRALDWNLSDDEANTVAGLVIHMAQSIPMVGQVFSFEGFRFEILARRENRITRLRIRPLPETAARPETARLA